MLKVITILLYFFTGKDYQRLLPRDYAKEEVGAYQGIAINFLRSVHKRFCSYLFGKSDIGEPGSISFTPKKQVYTLTLAMFTWMKKI